MQAFVWLRVVLCLVFAITVKCLKLQFPPVSVLFLLLSLGISRNSFLNTV